MRTGISIKITRPNRHRLEAIARDRNASQKHVWRANIVLLSADGVGTNEIMRQTGLPRTALNAICYAGRAESSPLQCTQFRASTIPPLRLHLSLDRHHSRADPESELAVVSVTAATNSI